MKKETNRLEVIRISNPEIIKYIAKQAERAKKSVQQKWKDDVKNAHDEFNKLPWIRRKLSWLFATKQVAAIQMAEFSDGLYGDLQVKICESFIRAASYKNTFFLSKTDTIYLWVPELWDEYTKTTISKKS